MACSKMLYRVVQNLQTDKHQNRAGNRNGEQSRTRSQADGGSNPQTRSSGESSDTCFWKIIVPAPIKPIPLTTCEAMREGSKETLGEVSKM